MSASVVWPFSKDLIQKSICNGKGIIFCLLFLQGNMPSAQESFQNVSSQGNILSSWFQVYPKFGHWSGFLWPSLVDALVSIKLIARGCGHFQDIRFFANFMTWFRCLYFPQFESNRHYWSSNCFSPKNKCYIAYFPIWILCVFFSRCS